MGKPELIMSVTQEDGVTILSVNGPVDSVTFEAFRQKVQALCAGEGAKVLVDCSGLTYLNSRSIGLLVTCHKRVLFGRGQFALCALNNRLVRTLELLELGQSLVTYPTRDEALAAMR